MEAHDIPVLTTPEAIADFLSLKLANNHINGLTFKDILEIHTYILTRVGRDYAETWGPVSKNADEDVHRMYDHLRDGAYYVLTHIEDFEDWYKPTEQEDLTFE